MERVARAIAVMGKRKQKTLGENFYDVMEDFKFVPGGRNSLRRRYGL